MWSTNHTAIWVCTNQASLRSISFHHALMYAVVKEKWMLSWITFILSVNHVSRVCQSQSMHAPRFLLRTRLFYLRFFTSARRQDKAQLLMRVSITLPSRSVSDSMTPFSLAARGSGWFLLTHTLSLQPWFFWIRTTL
jgi:hypothetical protein